MKDDTYNEENSTKNHSMQLPTMNSNYTAMSANIVIEPTKIAAIIPYDIINPQV